VSNPPASATPGSSFSVTDTAQNNGAVSAAASTTRYYLSLDATLGGDKLLTGTRPVGTLAPGATSPGTVNVTIPTSTAAGSYFLLACADDTKMVTETNETNNCKASAGKVTIGP
jgi:subtilase family serine protease